MKFRDLAVAAATVAALGFNPAAQASWSGTFEDAVNGVSGTLTDNGLSGGAEQYTLNFTMGSVGAAVGSLLTAVDIKAWGGSYSSYTFTASAGTWADAAGTGPIASGGAAGVDGCNGSSGGFACIQAKTPYLTMASGGSYTFNFSVFGANYVTSPGMFNTHVGIGFTQTDGSGNAGIVSTGVVSAIPEPETYAMLLAGLGLMGFVARRRTLAAA